MNLMINYLGGIEETIKTCNFLLEKRKFIFAEKDQVVEDCNMLCDAEVARMVLF